MKLHLFSFAFVGASVLLTSSSAELVRRPSDRALRMSGKTGKSGSCKGKGKSSKKIDDCGIDMAAYINEGLFPDRSAAPFGWTGGAKINSDTGGDCFETIAEVAFSELVLFVLRSQGDPAATALAAQKRNYVLCDKTFRIGPITNPLAPNNPPGVTFVLLPSGTGQFSYSTYAPADDAQLIVFNPNLRVSCDSCIIQATAETGVINPVFPTSREYFSVGRASDAGFAAQGLPVPDVSNLELDGLSFTQVPQAAEQNSVQINISNDQQSGPLTFKNLRFFDLYGTATVARVSCGIETTFEDSVFENMVLTRGGIILGDFECQDPTRVGSLSVEDSLFQHIVHDFDFGLTGGTPTTVEGGIGLNSNGKVDIKKTCIQFVTSPNPNLPNVDPDAEISKAKC